MSGDALPPEARPPKLVRHRLRRVIGEPIEVSNDFLSTECVPLPVSLRTP